MLEAKIIAKKRKKKIQERIWQVQESLLEFKKIDLGKFEAKKIKEQITKKTVEAEVRLK